MKYLQDRNWLEPYRTYGLSWRLGDEPAGNISYRCYSDCIRLIYRIRAYGDEDWQDIEQVVNFEWTSMHFGGSRRWFRCPRCRRRCRILYGGERFYCRKCWGLGYESQSETSWQRQITRAQKIRAKLGGSQGIEDPFPDKPKGMHWKTYERLQAVDERANAMWSAMVMDFMLKF